MNEIRVIPYDDSHAEIMAELLKRDDPESPATAQSIREADARHDPAMLHARWVGLLDGEVRGFGHYTQYPDLYQPRKFWMALVVHPEFRGRGLGGALWRQIRAALHEQDAIEVKLRIGEDQPESLAIARAQGFKDYSLRWPSRLLLSEARVEPFLPTLEKVQAAGIQLKSIRELEGDPERDARLRELQWLLDQDVPWEEPINELTQEQFNHTILYHPYMNHDGSFVAVYEGRYVGMTTLFKAGEDSLYVDLTGTIREFRKQGVSTALKVRATQYAREAGYVAIHTTNDPVNKGILAINERLGYVREAGVIYLKYLFAPDEDLNT